MSEFNLISKRKELVGLLEAYLNSEQVDIILKEITKQDKEFIRLLKEKINSQYTLRVINKLAGEELMTKPTEEEE